MLKSLREALRYVEVLKGGFEVLRYVDFLKGGFEDTLKTSLRINIPAESWKQIAQDRAKR